MIGYHTLIVYPHDHVWFQYISAVPGIAGTVSIGWTGRRKRDIFSSDRHVEFVLKSDMIIHELQADSDSILTFICSQPQ